MAQLHGVPRPGNWLLSMLQGLVSMVFTSVIVTLLFLCGLETIKRHAAANSLSTSAATAVSAPSPTFAPKEYNKVGFVRREPGARMQMVFRDCFVRRTFGLLEKWRAMLSACLRLQIESIALLSNSAQWTIMP